MRLFFLIGLTALLACSTETADNQTTGAGGAGGEPPLQTHCEGSSDEDHIALAVGRTIAPGADETWCLRWTADERIDISGVHGMIGPAGHHSLLLLDTEPNAPDGLDTCDEAELMDVMAYGDFSMLAGVSYETDGLSYEFPSAPVQVGLRVPAGAQLIFDAHFLNTSSEPIDACATFDLARGKPVVAALQFVTLLPEEQYGLTVPAMGSIDVSYEIAVGERVRLAAASSHMHQGGRHFRLSVKETGDTIFETESWEDPSPRLFAPPAKKVVEAEQTWLMECSFDNPSATAQRFPDQMCVGALYVLPCTLPGAC